MDIGVWSAYLLDPILQEVFFRGFLGYGLITRYGTARGIMLTSVLFGLTRWSPAAMVELAVFGSVLHIAYISTQSLLAPIALHALSNVLIFAPTLVRHPILLALLALPALVGWLILLQDKSPRGQWPASGKLQIRHLLLVTLAAVGAELVLCYLLTAEFRLWMAPFGSVP
jgi:hypothetical protein